ncbi:MAG: gfo/Idh/MocA family oxidoreductase [Acidimicrobiia bacterium]|nr:gfo/Idh/MocA family oxidoreductase [Acidimicrobiia bacterium]
MRVGVVGCGYWGSKHIRVLNSIDEVTGVAIIDAARAPRANLARVFPNATSFGSLDDSLDSVDAVIVATPPRSHRSIGLAALQAGKHVLVEKPLAASSADAEELVEAAEALGLVLMVGHTFEHNAAVWRLRDAVRSGELGRIHYIDSARLNLGLYQQDVNVMWDLAPHDISIVNFVLDAEPDAVTAWASAYAHESLEDVATIRLDYSALRVTASVRLSWLDPCKVRQTTVVGSSKMAVYDDLNDNERLRLYDRGVNPPLADLAHDMPVSYRYGDVVSPFVDFKEPLLVEDQHFVDSIRSGKAERGTGRSGLAVVRALEAAQASLSTGATVKVGAPRGAALASVSSR